MISRILAVLLALLATPSAAQTQRTLGPWTIVETASNFDGSPTVLLFTHSVNTIPARVGQPAPAILFLRCQEGRTTVMSHWNGQFMSDLQGRGRVDYRLIGFERGTVDMRASNDNSALGLWQPREAIRFIERLPEADELYLRATPYNGNPIEAVFNISGLDEAIAPLREACGW